MAIWNSQILITTAPLTALPNEWRDPAGAIVDFWGVVRALEDGREISGIEYEAHAAMAQHQLEKIVAEAREKFGVEEVILRHRVGIVAAGEASLFLRLTSAHRQAAFDGAQWIVAELKQKVPIWKRPLFVRREQSPRQLSRATK
jgi:molybdopterin synthase catalytic subunit